MSSQSQNSVSSIPVASAVAASGPVTPGTPSAVNSQTASVQRPVAHPVSFGIGKNVNRGKGGKLSGKGGALRHAGLGKNLIVGCSNPCQRKIGWRAGVKAVSKDVYGPNRDMMKARTMIFMKYAVCYAKHGKRKTLHKVDCYAALQRMGRTLYSVSK